MAQRIILHICVLLACAGLVWKFQGILSTDDAAQAPDSKLDQIVSVSMVETAFELTRANLVAGGAYRAALIALPGCPPGAIVVPINRTGEFQGLEKLLGGRTTFFVDGQAHEEFPTATFLLSEALTRLGFRNGDEPPFALINRSECEHSRFLAPS